MLTSFLSEELWEIQFYQVLHVNYWEFEMPDYLNVNISRLWMVETWNFPEIFQTELH